MSEVRISAEPRTEFGKGAARRIRRASKVPAVLYGHGTEPRHISLPGHELMLALEDAERPAHPGPRRRGRAGAAQGRPARPDQGLPRARRPGARPPRREGHRRDPAARRRRCRAGDPGHLEPQHPVGGGRGDPHPGRHRGVDRGPRASATRSTPGTSRCPSGATLVDRPGRARGQRHRRADRRAARGRAGRGRGRGRHRPRAQRRGAGRPAEPAEGAVPRATSLPPTEGDKAESLSLFRAGRRDRRRVHPARATSGWSSGSATPGPATPATGTTSASWWSTCWPTRMGGRFKAHKARADVVEGRLGRRPGRAGQAADLHERVRWAGRCAARLLQGPARAARSSCTTSSTCRTAACG